MSVSTTVERAATSPLPPPGPVVVLLDPITDAGWSYEVEHRILGNAGASLVVPRDAAAADAAIVDADVVMVTGLRRLDAATIGTLRRAVGILCCSVGTDQVDLSAAGAAGIPVSNVPIYCTNEVADHAMTLLLASWRRLVPLAQRTAAGAWDVIDDPDVRAIRRLRGATLGVVGVGRIGRAVAERARAFGMRTVAADPYVDGDATLPVLPLLEVMAGSDAVVICAQLTDQSRGLIDDTALSVVRPGLVLVNVARGPLIDEAALARAMRDGRVAAAALDVRDPEPPVPEADPLAGLPGLLLTPHIAASSREAVADLHEMAASISVDLLRRAGRLPRAASPPGG